MFKTDLQSKGANFQKAWAYGSPLHSALFCQCLCDVLEDLVIFYFTLASSGTSCFTRLLNENNHTLNTFSFSTRF